MVFVTATANGKIITWRDYQCYTCTLQSVPGAAPSPGGPAWQTAARETPAWMRTMRPRVGTGGRWWGLPFAAALTADTSAAVSQPRERGNRASHSPASTACLCPAGPELWSTGQRPLQWTLSPGSQPLCLGPPAKEVTLQGLTGGTGQGCAEPCLPTSKPHASHQAAGVCLHMFLSRDIMPGSPGDTGPALWYTEETHIASKFPKIE